MSDTTNKSALPHDWASLATITQHEAAILGRLVIKSAHNVMRKQDGGMPAAKLTILEAMAAERREQLAMALHTNFGARAAATVNWPGDFNSPLARITRKVEAAQAGQLIQQFVKTAELVTCAEALQRCSDTVDARQYIVQAREIFRAARWLLKDRYRQSGQKSFPSPLATMAIVAAEVPRLSLHYQSEMIGSLAQLTTR